MHKIKSLLIAAVAVLSIGGTVIPTALPAEGNESTESTEATTPPEVSLLDDGPFIE